MTIISDGTYVSKAIAPLDMFPQTYHAENESLLETN
jgi:tRNA/tmRNA/rRNA uracil-C5-methylase (TrmA/RlmC/RlmD family)